MLPVRTRLVVIGGVPVLLVVALLGWNLINATGGGSTPSAGSQGLVDSPGLSVPKPTEDPSAAAESLGNLPAAFAAAAKNDLTNEGLPLLADNKVTITLRSDGQMYFGYLFRSGPGDVKFLPREFSVSYTVVGGRPLAVVAVQALQGASYVTCSISVNGKLAARSRADGAGEIAGCRF